MIAGAEDKSWTPAQAAAAAAQQLPRGASVSLPGRGHVAPLFQAAPALVALITQFWQEPAGFIQRHSAATNAPTSP